MKRFKYLTVILLVAALSVVFLAACDLNVDDILGAVKDAAEKTEYPYSETGETEIGLNFAAIQTESYQGVNEWDIVYHDADEDHDYNLKSYTDNTGTVKKSKFVLTGGEDVLAYVRTSDESVDPAVVTMRYINETDKTVSEDSTADFGNMLGAVMVAGTYGVVRLTDDDGLANWTFAAKRTDIAIKDHANNDLETVEYEYTGARETGEYSDVKMLLNFKKFGITPILSRIYYEFYDESNQVTKTIVIYLTLHTEMPADADFVIPTAADGYTVA